MKKIIVFFICVNSYLTQEVFSQAVLTKTLTFDPTLSTSFMTGSTTYPNAIANCQNNNCGLTSNSYTISFDYYSSGGPLSVACGTTQIALPGVPGSTMVPYTTVINTPNTLNYLFFSGNFLAWAIKNVIVSYYDNTTNVSVVNSGLSLDFYFYQNQIYIINDEGNNDVVIELTDVLSQSVYKSTITNNSTKLNIPPGLYFASLTSSNGKSKMRKIIIE